jgi:hypothetical protein
MQAVGRFAQFDRSKVMVHFYIYLIDKTIFLQILVTVMARSHNNNMFITRDPSLLLVT